METEGCLFIISAFSGAGKTSLVRALLQADVNISLSISHTSRLPRSDEINGRDYHFINESVFKQMHQRGDFLESAEVYGNFYGTSREWIDGTILSGRDILLEIDCQGAEQIRRIIPRSVSVFILPPSMDALVTRLKTRGQDKSAVIEQRLAAVSEEINHINEYDYIIINNKLEEALRDINCIVQTERLRTTRQLVNHRDLISHLGYRLPS